MKNEQDFINICLSRTPMQECIMNNKVLGGIISDIPNIPFEEIKKKELIQKGQGHKIKVDKKTGEDQEIKVKIEEKSVYISRTLRYVAQLKDSDFLILDGYLHFYNGAYWEKIEEAMAMDCVALAGEKAGLLPVEAQQEGNKKKLLNQFVSDFVCPPSKIDDDNLKILVNLKNGTLGYSDCDFSFRDFDKNDMLRYQLSFDFNPNALCPQFDKFLDQVLPEKEAQDVLMEMIGYCFIPTRKLKLEQSMMLYGEGANGKGVIYELVKEILGKEHVSGFSMGALSFDANTRAQLSGKLLNYSSELGGKCNPDMIKKLISGEDVDVKTLYKDVWTMSDYTCKFMFNTNSLPKETEANVAFFRRWIILPFDVTIPKEKRDKKLPDKLKKELPGILNRVIAGIKRLIINEDFTESELARKTLEEYKVRSNTVLQFIQDEGWIASVPPDNTERKSAKTPHIDLGSFFKTYDTYCDNKNMKCASERTFIDRIKKIFYIQRGSTDNATWVFCQKKELESIQIPADNLVVKDIREILHID